VNPSPHLRQLIAASILRGALVLLVASSSLVHAADGALSSAAPVTGLKWPDWVVIVLYLGGVLGLGVYLGRRETNNAEYFTAARTQLPPFLVGVSLYAALLSTISYLGKPGETVSKGPVVLIGQILAVPVAYFVITRWIIPAIMQQRVTSAYELLELRLGVTGRLLGAVLFVKLRLVWMGLLVYISSTALAVIIGIDQKWVPLVSVVVGIVPLIYTTMGGLRTVIIANVVQFFLLLLGALLSIAIITVRCGGFSWWPTSWAPNWDHQPFFSLDPDVRATVFGATLSMAIWRICTAGGDQMVIQHFMATRDLATTRRSFLISCVAAVGITIVLAVLGLALLGFFAQFPEQLGPGMEIQKSADHLFPYFVSHLLPTGISGLVVAAILAASSGMDTGVSAVTAVTMKDFLERFGWRPATEKERMRVTKYISFGIGLAVVGASLLVNRVSGNFLEMTNKLATLEATTIFGLFFLALFVPSATPLAAVMGVVYGLSASIVIAFWDVITGRPGISFLYIGIIGLAFNLGVGYLVSRFGPRREQTTATRVAGAGLFALLVAGIWFVTTHG
jgi:SSS family solute:Na+ symporter